MLHAPGTKLLLIQYMQHVEEVHNMGIQYKQQGEDVKMQIPSEPTIFLYVLILQALLLPFLK